VAHNAEEQNQSLASLAATMEELSRLIHRMGDEVVEALKMTEIISGKARLGEQSLRVMNESMEKIGDSSAEMTGIIQIINDISDRINLLSLNAAIEAARAGDYGRGFAVVADEISKLADQTASSIKDIDKLIHTNESEIMTGARNVGLAVDNIVSIISTINTITGKISAISALMKQQMSSNEVVNRSAELVRTRSEEIMHAMNEQKSAISEITKTTGNINELSQHNTMKIDEMTESSRMLADMVEKLNREIEKYEDSGIAT
jgi:methyl-accepting chemotaxis protein